MMLVQTQQQLMQLQANHQQVLTELAAQEDRTLARLLNSQTGPEGTLKHVLVDGTAPPKLPQRPGDITTLNNQTVVALLKFYGVQAPAGTAVAQRYQLAAYLGVLQRPAGACSKRASCLPHVHSLHSVHTHKKTPQPCQM